MRQLTIRSANGSPGIRNGNAGTPTLTLQDVSVTDNHRGNGTGGGIVSGSFGATLILNAGTSISGNTAFSGPGIWKNGDLTLNAGASISGNEASGSGGGIASNSGTVVLNADSNVTGNKVFGGSGSGGTGCSS